MVPFEEGMYYEAKEILAVIGDRIVNSYDLMSCTTIDDYTAFRCETIWKVESVTKIMGGPSRAKYEVVFSTYCSEQQRRLTGGRDLWFYEDCSVSQYGFAVVTNALMLLAQVGSEDDASQHN